MNLQPEAMLARVLVGCSQAIRRVRDAIQRAAPSRIAVLIQGETGTGKELVASALHTLSGRRGNYVAINSSALNDGLFESTVFGHVKGAFSGAVRDKRGLLELADSGTLFLDEIGRMPHGLQAKLLRAIEMKQFSRLGDDSLVRHSEFRVVSASNESLDALVERGEFRADLLHRLKATSISLPTLRDRLEDIPELTTHFLTCASDATNGSGVSIGVSSEAISSLQAYHWPGNVRQLRNVIEAAIAFRDGPLIDRATIGRVLPNDVLGVQGDDLWCNRETLMALLNSYNGRVKDLALAHGVHQATVYRWLERLAIPTPRRSSSLQVLPACIQATKELR